MRAEKQNFRRFFRAREFQRKIKVLDRLSAAENTCLHAYFPELQIFDRVKLLESLAIRKRMGQLKNLNLLNKTVLFIFQLLSELKCSQKRAKNGLKTDRTSGPNASNRLRIANFGLRIEAQKAECLGSCGSLPRTPIRGGNDGGVVHSAFGEPENRQTGKPDNWRTDEPHRSHTRPRRIGLPRRRTWRMIDLHRSDEDPMTTDQAERLHPELWVHDHGDYLFRYAYYRLGDVSAAEDAVQDTFIAALRGQAGFSGKSSERTWLVGILKHKLMDRLRQQYRDRDLRESAENEAAWQVDFNRLGLWMEAPGSWRIDPAAIRERREFWEILQQCLKDLPDMTAQAYMMREIDGLPTEEVCKVLGLSANNLWVRLHRARSALRRCLEKKWFGKRLKKERR
jgi:RNA polymerase sigma-70 factor (ECF subfamily)